MTRPPGTLDTSRVPRCVAAACGCARRLQNCLVVGCAGRSSEGSWNWRSGIDFVLSARPPGRPEASGAVVPETRDS